MGDKEPKHQAQVQLALSLRTSPPHAISIHEANPAESLKLICSVKQTSSPFPDRAVTILTSYSCLDESAFFYNWMSSPAIINAQGIPHGYPARELYLRANARIYAARLSGDADLLKRPDEDSTFRFLTIPPVGQGQTEISFDLPPSKLLSRLGDKSESLEDKLVRFLRPGDSYKIEPQKKRIVWWSFGALEGEEGLMKKRLSRWSLPDDLPLVREPGADETDDVANKLEDLVDHHNINQLHIRSCYEGEQKPVVREMRRDGWVFGEPSSGLVMTYDPAAPNAVFTITE
ncbi:hypothetical protein F4777DRAFT_544306 [Nemania sp. FL0916]|nr:hypothetical protein F4777DRAFT_544306 [Nemania sp. FL0916]